MFSCKGQRSRALWAQVGTARAFFDNRGADGSVEGCRNCGLRLLGTGARSCSFEGEFFGSGALRSPCSEFSCVSPRARHSTATLHLEQSPTWRSILAHTRWRRWRDPERSTGRLAR